MTLSVNTNKSAMIALQNLTKTNDELEITQARINTGLRVVGAKDNAAVYAIAQGMRGDIGALDAVGQSLSRAVGIIDVALAAGEAVSDILVEMKAKAVAAIDPSLDTASRNALNEDFVALRDQIATIVTNATFDGANLLDGSLTPGISVLADADAVNSLTIPTENLTLSSSIITLATTSTVSTATSASISLALVTSSLDNVNAALGRLGSAAKKIETHQHFVTKLQDTLRSGVGNLVDADLATESAKLQALQVKQQLGVQALSIANTAPQILLSLFR